MDPIRFDEPGGWALLLLGVTLIIQLVYLLGIFSKLAFHKLVAPRNVSTPVSVIICARNELLNLQEHLHAILSQEYPEFQVVVVNDCSWDESGKYLEEIQPQYPHLKVVTLNEQEKYRHGKKFALSLGIKAAKYDCLLLTDADCVPVSSNWIKQMVSGYEQDTEIIIGYGAYKKSAGLLNKWVRMDTVFNAVQFISLALAHQPYMGVGRNLSYRKSLFFKNKGFASHNHVMSGDDDLFVNETATHSNTRVELHPDSFTASTPRNTFGSWLQQKKRHMSTGKYYKTGDKFRLGLFFMSMFLFYCALATLIITGFTWQIILGTWLLRLLIQMIIFGQCMKKLAEFDIVWMVPFFDIAVVLLYPAITFSNLLIKDKTWK